MQAFRTFAGLKEQYMFLRILCISAFLISMNSCLLQSFVILFYVNVENLKAQFLLYNVNIRKDVLGLGIPPGLKL